MGVTSGSNEAAVQVVDIAIAAAQVMADPTALTLAQKTMYSKLILGVGYTNVGMIGAQTIAGFADGGFTGYGGKYDVAGVVHRGEGVLTQEEIKAIGGPSGFNQLRASIKNGYSDGGIVSDTTRSMRSVNAITSSGNASGTTVVQPKVVINNYSSEKVETSTNQDGEMMVTIGKMLDQKIDSGVDRGIQRNLRQGHPLANAIKGR